jgi:hypothetical protein
LGAFDFSSVPDLRWYADSEEIQPNAVRALQGARGSALLGGRSPEVFTGVYELSVPPGGKPPHVLRVSSANATPATLYPRTMPSKLDDDGDQTLRILLVSCFDWREDRAGRAGRLITRIPVSERPDLTVLMGDQVYLDLPTLANFRKDAAWLAVKFEQDYRRTWEADEGLRKILRASPSLCLPDDHEYWNNFPNPSPFVQNTWTQDGRRNWRLAASALFEAFQQPWPTPPGEPTIFDIPPLSFFLADSRTHREEKTAGRSPQAFGEPTVAALDNWADRLELDDLLGVFITGQSLFEGPRHGLKGKIADLQLANHRHYRKIMKSLARCPNRGRDILCVTGDLHFGRVSRAGSSARGHFFEVVSSPASLVGTVGADQAKQLWSFLRRVANKESLWPRHPQPRAASPILAPEALGKRYPTSDVPDTEGVCGGHRGNQAVMLALRRRAAAVECEIIYYPIHRDPWLPARSFRIDLQTRR